MAHQLAYDREAGLLGGALHGRGDVADPVARARLLDPRLERRLAGLQQALRTLRDIADGERVRLVGHEPLEGDADVDGEEIAVLDPVGARDAVHDLVVDRRAQ